MIDNEELLTAVYGMRKVSTYREVAHGWVDLARVAKELIAEDLDGTLPPTGKQFLTTRLGRWRLAARHNTDNTTERAAHEAAGVKYVQIFGELSALRRAQGWISVEELYALHRVRFDEEAVLVRIRARIA